MVKLTPKRKGELLILLGSLTWSLFPIVTILTLSRISPLFSAGFSTLVAALFFAVLLTVKGQWADVFVRGIWKDIFLAAFFMGVLYYGFFFFGLRYTTAGNGAILGLMEVFFSFLVLGLLLRHETLGRRSIIGGTCMVIGALFILSPERSNWHEGDILVLLATLFAPLGNMYAQRARKRVSTAFIMFCRSLLGSMFLLLLALLVEPLPTAGALTASLPFIAINGILILGLHTVLWVEGIHRIPITTAISLDTIDPLFTLIIAYFVLQERVQIFQIVGFVPIVLGVYLLIMGGKQEAAAAVFSHE